MRPAFARRESRRARGREHLEVASGERVGRRVAVHDDDARSTPRGAFRQPATARGRTRWWYTSRDGRPPQRAKRFDAIERMAGGPRRPGRCPVFRHRAGEREHRERVRIVGDGAGDDVGDAAHRRAMIAKSCGP